MKFTDLPIEIRSKIMYSGWIIHPVANLIKNHLKSVSFLRYAEIGEECPRSYYDHLLAINFLLPKFSEWVVLVLE